MKTTDKVISKWQTYVTKQPSKRLPTSYYVSNTDRKEILGTLGDAAYILYEFYISKAGLEGYTFDDKSASKALGWSLRKTSDVRLKLTKANMFYQEAARFHNKASNVAFTYLGSDKVIEAKIGVEK